MSDTPDTGTKKSFLQKLKHQAEERPLEVVAVLVSIAALVLSVRFNRQSVEIARKTSEEQLAYNRASTSPRLVFTSNLRPSDERLDFVGVQIENRGPGSAEVAPPLLIVPGQAPALMTSGNTNLLAGFPSYPSGYIKAWGVSGSMILAPGESQLVLWVIGDRSEAEILEMKRIIGSIEVIVKYTSLYEGHIMYGSLHNRFVGEELFDYGELIPNPWTERRAARE